jgi:hypothetical protein
VAALRRKNALLRAAKSGSPGKRAAAYAALGLGAAGVGAFGGPAVLAALPLAAAGGTGAVGNTFKLGRDRWKRRGMAAGGSSGGALTEENVAGILTAKSTRTVLRQADDHHRNIIRVNDRTQQRALAEEYVRDGIDKARARQVGRKHPNGLNMAFRGFADDDERMKALSLLSKATGLAEDQLMLGSHGLAMPVPVYIDKRTGKRAFAPGTTIEQASNPVHYMDRYTLQRQTVDGAEENDDQYIARLTAQLRERGYVSDNGEVVDVFAAHGFDTRVPEVGERVAAFISGNRDDELAKIVVNARRSEDAAVRASRDWAGDHA